MCTYNKACDTLHLIGRGFYVNLIHHFLSSDFSDLSEKSDAFVTVLGFDESGGEDVEDDDMYTGTVKLDNSYILSPICTQLTECTVQA